MRMSLNDPLYLAKTVFYIAASKALLNRETRNDLTEKLSSFTGKLQEFCSKVPLDRLGEGLILGGTAYYGYKALKEKGLVIGPLGYKLATSMGGNPPIAKGLGLLLLANIGLVNLDAINQLLGIMSPDFTDWLKRQEEEQEKYYEDQKEEIERPTAPLPEDYETLPPSEIPVTRITPSHIPPFYFGGIIPICPEGYSLTLPAFAGSEWWNWQLSCSRYGK